jgi:hypothetical protein
MPTLTPAQHKKVRAMLDARTLDAAKAIFRVTLGLDEEQVCKEAMDEVRTEIAHVFYPLIGRLIPGENVNVPAALPPAPPEVVNPTYAQQKADIEELVKCALIVPDLPQRMKEAAERIFEWMK